MPDVSLPTTILRANDIRGTWEKDLGLPEGRLIGRAYGTIARAEGARRIALCFDGRLSSPALAEAVAEGLVACGLDAELIGLGPSPMLYFAVHRFGFDGGIMITGSHNPPDMNGMKMMLGAKSFHGERIAELGRVAGRGRFAEGRGEIRHFEAREAYLEALRGAYRSDRGLKVAWDPGNGAAGEVVRRLAASLPGQHLVINAEIDGRFPNHHPDPTVPANLRQLIDLVRREGCDLGVAFDGDGDRIGAVDGQGRIVWGDQMLAFLAEEVLGEHPGATVIADVKASDQLFARVAELGGCPVMWKTGHAFIKTKMIETGALLAGEMSGHIFFADRNYGYDDGVYAAVRFISMLAGWDCSLAERMDRLPRVSNTPELRFACADSRKFAVVEEVRARLAGAGRRIVAVDGLRVASEGGWWLLRASNTQPVLVGRCEGPDEAAVGRLLEQLHGELRASGVEPRLTE
ncbi:MAG: phosphomannomutase/phosphoglucomutase [Alphaproteobacteria bacterium]|nr:phosphomannomutase/phosphoglucomutase [Alphaproteobacteria bacterium]